MTATASRSVVPLSLALLVFNAIGVDPEPGRDVDRLRREGVEAGAGPEGRGLRACR